jgi:stage II sporulation protein E
MVALSDGMGHGVKAQQVSHAALELLKEFYEAGFSQQMLYTILNELLMWRSGGESFATLDTCVFDMQKGEVNWVKIGGAPSYIVYNDRVKVLNAAALPMGIVKEAKPAFLRTPLRNDMAVVLVSDGVSDTVGQENMERFLGHIFKNPAISAKAAAESIIQSARSLSKEQKDDMTAIVVMVRPGS